MNKAGKIPVIIGIMFLTTIFSCTVKEEEREKFAKKNFPAEEGKEISLLYTENGIKTTEIRAGRMIRYEKPENALELKDGVTVLFYDSLGKISAEWNAMHATHYPDKGLLIAKKNIVLTDYVENKKMETEELSWNEKTGKIHSDAFVTITTKDEIITGEGFEAEQDFSRYKIKKIKGNVKISIDE